MRVILVYIFNLIPCWLIGQYSNVPYQKLEALAGTKTYVVLFGDDEFNEKLKQSVATYWKATEYVFINLEDVDEYIRYEGQSMLLPLVKDGTELFYMYYILIYTGKKSVQSYIYPSWLAQMIIPSQERFEIRMDNIIQCMNHILSISQEQKFEGGPVKMGKQYVKYYNQNTYLLKEGILYIEKELLEKNLQEYSSDIKTIYPYNYEVVSNQRIKEIVETKENNAYYCVVDGNQSIIFEASTGKIIYCDLEMKPVYEISKNVLKNIVESSRE